METAQAAFPVTTSRLLSLCHLFQGHTCIAVSFFSSLGVVDKWGGEGLSGAWIGKQLVGGGAPSRPVGQQLGSQLPASASVAEKAPQS